MCHRDTSLMMFHVVPSSNGSRICLRRAAIKDVSLSGGRSCARYESKHCSTQQGLVIIYVLGRFFPDLPPESWLAQSRSIDLSVSDIRPPKHPKCFIESSAAFGHVQDLAVMYESLQIPWSTEPCAAEVTYRDAGLVRTHGTVFLLPPSDNVLIATFNAPPRARSTMSAGAVALCKHFERGGASSEHAIAHPYWPLPMGNNERKTALAANVLARMLSEVCWRNVLLLHRGVAVYEIRQGAGYGMRWTLELSASEVDRLRSNDRVSSERNDLDGVLEDPSTHVSVSKVVFRGFLEPIVDIEIDSSLT